MAIDWINSKDAAPPMDKYILLWTIGLTIPIVCMVVRNALGKSYYRKPNGTLIRQQSDTAMNFLDGRIFWVEINLPIGIAHSGKDETSDA